MPMNRRLRLFFLFILFLNTLTPADYLFAQSADPAEWTTEYINELALSWPDNAIENVPPRTIWRPPADRRLVIVQIGDSHVQGDMAAAATRVFLAQLLKLPTPPRGYTFPFAIASSNEPHDIRSSAEGTWLPAMSSRSRTPQPYGLAAAALDAYSPADSIHIAFAPINDAANRPTSVSVLFDPLPQIPTPRLNGAMPDTLSQQKGVATFALPDGTESLSLTLKVDGEVENPFRFLGFVMDDATAPFMFHAAGLNGADVNTHIRNTILPFELQLFNPQIIVVSLGTNDAYNLRFSPVQFRDNLALLVGGIQRACPGALIILATPNDHLLSTGEVNPRVQLAAEVIRNFAIDSGLALWDFHRIMGGPGSIRSWNAHGLTARDCLHFSPLGYALQGRLLATALYRLLKDPAL